MGKNTGFLAWLRRDGRGWVLPLLALVGILFLILPGRVGSEGTSDGTSEVESLCASIEGVGECRIMLSYADDGRSVQAVAVICDGADRLEVRHRLTELLSSFYGIGYNRISIEKRG